MGVTLKDFEDFVRWRDWAPGKIPVFCTLLAYIALANRNLSHFFVFEFILFMLFASVHSALGYIVNDWGDRKIDKLHGKPNAFEKISHKKAMFILGLLIMLSIFTGLPFSSRPLFFPLWMAWAFFAVAYSVKPFRFKERGLCGLGVSAIAQWTLPILIVFAALERFGRYDMIVFAVVSSISGATLEIAHQRYDRKNDLSTKTKTCAVRLEGKKMDLLYSIAVFFDKIAICIVLITVLLGITRLDFSEGWQLVAWKKLLHPLIIGYLILFFIALLETIRLAKKDIVMDPYYSTERTANKLLHETIPNLILPVYLLGILSIFQPVNAILLIVFLYWRLILGKADLLWPLRIIRGLWKK
ncbi:MAG: UbiA prenyltransferase family protein [Candidatus Omnitrophica bacterium]|nr:UbiA prenyltransferase family protein [Candidatus Omnitrophota bacterium]